MFAYLKALKAEAQPDVDRIKEKASNIAANINNSKAVQVSKVLGHKTMVKTVGVGLGLAEPVYVKGAELLNRAWDKVETLAADPKATK